MVPKWDDIAVPIWPTERQFFPVGCSQTTFVLPFDTAEKPEATAFAEIERGLEGLDCKTLLFLRHIETIEVVLPGKRIVIERDEEKERWGLPEILPAEAKHVMLKTSLEPEAPKHYLRFDCVVKKKINDDNGCPSDKSVPIGLAYKLEPIEKDGQFEYKVVEDPDAGVYVSFRAKSETSGLRYSINGAFAPALSRDNIRDVPENGDLLRDIVELQKRSVDFLKQNGLLTIDFLGVLPNSVDSLGGNGSNIDYSLFRTGMKELFDTQPYTPTIEENVFAPAQNLYRGYKGDGDVREFLGTDGLHALIGNDNVYWVRNTLRNSRADKFLSGLSIHDLDGELVVSQMLNPRVCEGVVSQKRPEQLKLLYRFLVSYDNSLNQWWNWRESQNAVQRRKQQYKSNLRDIQFILLSDGRFVSVNKNHPRRIVYNRQNAETCDEVHPDFNRMITELDEWGETIRKFFKLVGITADDTVDNLKYYIENTKIVSDSDDQENVRNFLLLLDLCQNEQVTFEVAKKFPVLACNGDTAETVPLASTFIDEPYCSSGLSLLSDFYTRQQGAERKWELDLRYVQQMTDEQKKYFIEHADDFGVIRHLQIKKHVGYSALEMIRRCNFNRTRLLNVPGQWRDTSKIYDYDSASIQYVLEVVSLEGDAAMRLACAQLLWRYVIQKMESDGCLQAYVQKNNSNPSRSDNSTLVCRLSNACWVPQQRNDEYVFLKPSDARIRLLPPNWEPAKGGYEHPMLKVIGFKWHEGEGGSLNDIRCSLLDGLRRHLGEIGCRNRALTEACECIEGAKRAILNGKNLQDSCMGLQKAIFDAGRLIETQEDLRGDLLMALRRRISQIGYGPEKLLFELFQNADDAYMQNEAFHLEQTRDGCEFLVRWDCAENKVVIVHWGRSINKQHIQIPGSERDLENMLQMHQSDKQAEAGVGVTGKFGLGFKTVFLVSDAPYLLSGELRVRILGGYLPCELTKDDHWILDLIPSYTQDEHLPPTIVVMPLREDAKQAMELAWESFKCRAPYLVNCARRVKKITIEKE